MTQKIPFAASAAMLIALAAAPAYAETCGAIDLRPALGAPRDQGNTGWCFAHTTADLITHKTRTRVSAFDLGIQFAATEIADLESSPSRAVRDYLREVPSLLEVVREARDADRGLLEPKILLTEDGILSHGGIEDASLLIANHRGLCEDRFFRDGEKGFKKHLREIRKWVKDAQSNGVAAAPLDIPEASRPIFRKLLGWLENQCGRRVPLREDLVPRALYVANSLKDLLARREHPDYPLKSLQQKLWAEVDQALDEGKASAVGYSAFDITEQAPDETTLDGDHSSVIAARRRGAGGKCEYFVRNSWGASCELYLKPWLSRCEEAHGGVWVEKTDLQTFYSVVTYR